jgi:hypothetical protein
MKRKISFLSFDYLSASDSEGVYFFEALVCLLLSHFLNTNCHLTLLRPILFLVINAVVLPPSLILIPP